MPKYNVRRKGEFGLDIQYGGRAIPIGRNMVYFDGNSHENGGIGVGNELEVEGGEVGEYKDNTLRVFSSVPFLRGVSPAQLVMGGANPNKVFKAQENFKDRNRINDDGTHYQNGGQTKSNSAIRIEEDKKVSARNRAIYSAVDATSDYPAWWQAIGLGIGSNFKTMINPDSMNYTVTDSVADAAWRKRLGLSYNNKFLIPNKDGSVRLPKNVEMEIPTDTTMLKKRIAANEQFANQNNIMGEDWKIVQAMIDKDKEALEALRTTYKTGKPVVINEYAHNTRKLSKNGELIDNAINYKSPLNVMRNYTIQYDPKNKSMNYWDTYDFNEFEWGVPGKPFEIKGNIPLKKAGGIYIKPSKRGTFTAAATKHGMGVQEFANKVLANKEDYSPAMVKKANFARNASRWKKEYGGDYEPKRNEKGQIVLNLNNPDDVKWLHEQQGKRGAKAVHRGQQEFLESALNRTAPIMLGVAMANPITTATSLAGGYLLGEVGELGGELYKGLTGEDYTREGKVIGQTIGGLGGPIGAKLFGKGATNAWNTYKSNKLNSTQTLIDVPETGLSVRPNIRVNRPKQLDVTNNQKYLPTDVEDLTWKEPKALLETQAQVTRRDLKNFNRWAKLFGYEPVPLRYAETKSIADRHVQDRIKQHNTFLRGVAKPNKLQKQAIEYELAKEGITNPTDYDVYTYMATHSAPTTGAGRADLRPIQVRKRKVGNFNLSKTSDSPIGALYTQGSGRGAAGYAGLGPMSGGYRRTGVVVEVARPTNFRPEASYAEWVKENDFNFGDIRSKGFHKKVANRVVETGKAPEAYNLSAKDKQVLFNEIKNEFAARPEPVYETAKHALDYIKNHRPNIVKNITQLDESAFNSLSNDSKRAYNEYLGKLMILNPKAVSFSKEVKKENDRFKNTYRDAVILEGKRRKNKYLSDIDYNPEDYTQPDYSVLKSTSRNRGNAQQHYIFRAPIGEKILEGRGFYLPTEEEIINATTDHYPLWTPGYSRNTRKFGGIKKFKFGGSMIYTINGNVRNELMSARPKAKYGKEKKINANTKIGEDGLIYTKAIDGDWYTDGTRYEDSKYYMGRKSAQAYSREKFKRQAKPQSLDEVIVTGTRPKSKEESKPIITSSNNGNTITTQTIEGKQVDYPKTKTGYKPFTYKKDKDGKLVKVYDDDKRYNNSYIRPNREGANYKSNKYNPLTGETVDEYGIVETSEPSIMGTTKVSSSTSSTPRGRVTNAAKSTTSTKSANVEAKQPKLVERPKENLYITGIKNNAVKSPLMTGMEKISANPASSSTGGETQPKDGRWVGQYKTTNVGDWIGLGANLAGTIGSYFINKSSINKMPMPLKPVMAQAAKLKTRYNINPQLTEISEAEQMNRASVRRNTQSSSSSLAREQRLINEARGARNVLYGQKENIETQLINQDRLNRQSVNMQNVKSYNDYLNRVTATKTAQSQLKISNVNNLISGLTGSVNSILGNIESRRATNNTIRAIAAANPNVDARLIGGFDYYIDPITKRKYNKNQQYVGTING